MDGEGRVGPLSYDVTTDTGYDPDRPLLIGGLVAAALLIVSIVVGWFVLGVVANPRVVTTGFPIVVLVAPVGLGIWLSRNLKPRARRNAILVIGLIAAGAAFLSTQAVGTIKPAMPQVRYAITSVDIPAGYTLVSEDTHGDRFCRRGCPTVVRVYRPPAGTPDPAGLFARAMVAAGWKLSGGSDPTGGGVLSKGDLGAQVQEKDGPVVEVFVQRKS